MVTYDKAFSTNLQRSLTAQNANELFTGKKWDGSYENTLLLTNDEFQCSYNCDLKLTCVNIYVDFSESYNYQQKRHPYFSSKTGLSHSINCDRVLKQYEKRKAEKSQTQYYTQEGNKFILSFKKGIGFSPVKEGSKSSQNLNSKNNSASKTKNTQDKTFLYENKRIPHISSINRMIELFEEYLSNDHSIELFNEKRRPISFNDVFTPINNELIDNAYTIYYGEAYIKWIKLKNNKKALFLSFSKNIKLTENGDELAPYVFLFESNFEKNKKKTLYTKLITYADKYEQAPEDNKPSFMLYYVGTFSSSKSGVGFDYQKNNIPKSLFIPSI